MGLVLSSKVSLAEANETLSKLASTVDLALVQSFDSSRIIPVGDVTLERWDSARYFGMDAEVRLRRTGSEWAMLVLTDSPASVEGWPGERAEAHRYGPPEQWRLWGERDGESYRDDRIPAHLSYPSTLGRRAAIEIVRYRIGDEPLPTLARYLRLVDEAGK